jgi:hypothetical protein
VNGLTEGEATARQTFTLNQEGALQRAFPLDVLMVPSSMLPIDVDGERG